MNHHLRFLYRHSLYNIWFSFDHIAASEDLWRVRTLELIYVRGVHLDWALTVVHLAALSLICVYNYSLVDLHIRRLGFPFGDYFLYALDRFSPHIGPRDESRTGYSVDNSLMRGDEVVSQTHADLRVLLGKGGLEENGSVCLGLGVFIVVFQDVSEFQYFLLQFIEMGELSGALQRRIELLHYFLDLLDQI